MAESTRPLAYGPMPSTQLFLIRHGETPANVAGRWQGHGDDGLTDRGLAQAGSLGARLEHLSFDLVVSSDLDRAATTAAAVAGRAPVLDPAWREMDLGRWEGLAFEEVRRRRPVEAEAIRHDPDATYGGGETWRRLCSRIDAAAAGVIDQLGEGQRALVVTHGGAIQAFLAAVVGFPNGGRPWPVDFVRNTALTVIEIEGDLRRALVISDARHIEAVPSPDEQGAVIALVRHGETEANLTGVWQGNSEGTLTGRGLEQGAELAAWYDSVDHVYTSPLRRARMTADAFAAVNGLPVTEHPDLHEIAFGSWEGLTPSEIRRRHPEQWQAVYEEGRDEPRGTTGETFAGARARLGAALEQIAAAHRGGRVAVVTHGGVIRSYVGGVVGLGHPDRGRLGLPANTSVSHVRVRPHRGAVLVDYNLGAV